MKYVHRIGEWLLPNGLYDHFRFELRSLIGRLVTRPLPLEKFNSRYLNLGCGNVYLPQMINVDFFTNRRKDYGLDLRYPFKMPDDSMDGIFCDHTMEHLSYEELEVSLRECCRVLKPGGVLRIVVPDMSLFATKYAENDMEWFDEWKSLVLAPESRAHYRPYFSRMFALNFTANFYYHKTCWDPEVAELLLKRAGFSGVTLCSYREGSDGLLWDKDSEDRRLISMYVEAKK